MIPEIIPVKNNLDVSWVPGLDLDFNVLFSSFIASTIS
jgi:hypothetical protein